MINDFLKAKNLAEEFTAKYLNADIDNLASFDFCLLEQDKQFECPARNFDPDDTNITKALYIIIWSDLIPDLSFNNIGTGCLYRGDTLNTFNTLFGKDCKGIRKYTNDVVFIESVENFKKCCFSIGNFLPLPNKAIEIGNTTHTINTFRGTNSWRDYQDKYLLELKKCLENKFDKNSSLSSLIDNNSFYFEHLENSFENYIKINFLTNYVDNNDIKDMFSPCLYHWMNKNISELDNQQYISFAQNYIECCSKIISNRSEAMLQKLKERLVL